MLRFTSPSLGPSGCSQEEVLLSPGWSFGRCCAYGAVGTQALGFTGCGAEDTTVPSEMLIASYCSFLHHTAAAGADGKLIFTVCNILKSCGL